MVNPLHEIEVARKAARAGAVVVKKQYGLSREMQIKDASNTLVTPTDMASEAAILRVLRENSPYGIVSEEDGRSGPSEGPLWIVDPVDGTSNFARSLPLFVVSVALVEGDRVHAGVIVDPLQEKEFTAGRGIGAFCNDKLLRPAKNQAPVPSLFLNHGHHAEDKQRFAEVTRRLAVRFNLRKLGTTALELCYVAEGWFDGFICSGDELWDYAAGVLIATESGCLFTNWQGLPWDGESDFLLVARPEIHQALVKEIHDII